MRAGFVCPPIRDHNMRLSAANTWERKDDIITSALQMIMNYSDVEADNLTHTLDGRHGYVLDNKDAGRLFGHFDGDRYFH